MNRRTLLKAAIAASSRTSSARTRDLESLVDEVYIANYKMAGQAFWCPVAYVEESLFDLLGRPRTSPSRN